MRETTFKVPYEIPTTPATRYHLRCYLISLQERLGRWGEEGQDVGFGFLWGTGGGLYNGGISVLSRKMLRVLRSSGIISPRAEVYFLPQRIKFVREEEPGAVFTLQEEN